MLFWVFSEERMSVYCLVCFPPLKPTSESMTMANGLVSRHAYTVTGAEQVRLPVDTVPQSSCSPKQESESHAELSPAKLKWVLITLASALSRPITDNLIPCIRPNVLASGIPIPQGHRLPSPQPEILLSLNDLREAEYLARLGDWPQKKAE